MNAIAGSLQTERLRLRRPRADDFESLAAIAADPEVMRFMSAEGKPQTRAQAWRSFATLVGHWELRGYGMWILEELTSGNVVGRGGLWNPEGWPGLEVGWTLARSAWGKGYATEMALAAVGEAKSRLGAKRIISVILPSNERSICVAKRIGEEYEGDFDLEGLKLSVYGMVL